VQPVRLDELHPQETVRVIRLQRCGLGSGFGGSGPGFPIVVVAPHGFGAPGGCNYECRTTYPEGIAGFGTTIFPLLFVAFNFRQLSLTSSTTDSSISSRRCISLAATAETMRSQAGPRSSCLCILAGSWRQGTFWPFALLVQSPLLSSDPSHSSFTLATSSLVSGLV